MGILVQLLFSATTEQLRTPPPPPAPRVSPRPPPLRKVLPKVVVRERSPAPRSPDRRRKFGQGGKVIDAYYNVCLRLKVQ